MFVIIVSDLLEAELLRAPTLYQEFFQTLPSSQIERQHLLAMPNKTQQIKLKEHGKALQFAGKSVPYFKNFCNPAYNTSRQNSFLF